MEERVEVRTRPTRHEWARWVERLLTPVGARSENGRGKGMQDKGRGTAEGGDAVTTVDGSR